MQLKINGELKEFSGELTVYALLESLGIAGKQVAVELNREVIKKEDYMSVSLKDGDIVEIIHFVGGG
ncbi:MAG: sulfur carrier protein ThiS [Candidatus Schekmanbacteria bacterium]|nr:sulfur carrier protein ThiS [Candidatus Schekmanbacteria bacterium]